jgi:transcription elongation factor Elf1
MAKKKSRSKPKKEEIELTIAEKLAKHQCPRCNAYGYHETCCIRNAGYEVTEYVCGNCGLRIPADQVPG